MTFTRYWEGRGNNDFNSWWALDFSARYQFPIWRELNGWLQVSVINLLNQSTLVQYQTTGSSGTNQAGNPAWVPRGSCDESTAPNENCS